MFRQSALYILLIFVVARSGAQYQAKILHPESASSSRANGTFGGTTAGSYVAEATGYVDHACIWSGPSGSFIDLNEQQMTSSLVSGVSASNQVGSASFNGSATHAVLWSGTASSWQDLHPETANYSFCTSTDGARQVGVASFGLTPREHAMLWYGSANTALDLHPDGFNSSAAHSTNGNMHVGIGISNGQSNALLWTGESNNAVVLNPQGFRSCNATSIFAGQQGGYGWRIDANSYHALMWSGTASSAIDLHPEGFLSSQVYGVTGNLQVGFVSGIDSGHPNGFLHACYWRGTATSAIDLHSLLPSTFVNSTATSVDPVTGSISGIAYDDLNIGYSVVWMSVPEPSTLSFIALASLAIFRKRSKVSSPHRE